MSMSSAISFDTLQYSKRLREVGVPEPQADAQAELLAEALAERLASKEDLVKAERDLVGTIETTKAELQRDIETTRAELKRDIANVDAKIETTKAE
ncbi:MAG: hypothetical protein HQL96_06195, partial [Magnetococcales bacterium]|nr:hypothetical protein [Magnetococcales bacterium]